MTILFACQQAAGEPMAWWQALITVVVIFWLAVTLALLTFGGRR